VDRVHASVDWPGALGPPWTDGGADRGGPGRGGALTGARPPAAPVHQSSPAGAQQREERTGRDGGAEPEAVTLSERKARARREAKSGWETCGELRGWCSPFIGVGGAPGRGGRGVNAGVNGFNAIEDGGGFKRGSKGGKMKARW
jgi:hypothetical protein